MLLVEPRGIENVRQAQVHAVTLTENLLLDPRLRMLRDRRYHETVERGPMDENRRFWVGVLLTTAVAWIIGGFAVIAARPTHGLLAVGLLFIGLGCVECVAVLFLMALPRKAWGRVQRSRVAHSTRKRLGPDGVLVAAVLIDKGVKPYDAVAAQIGAFVSEEEYEAGLRAVRELVAERTSASGSEPVSQAGYAFDPTVMAVGLLGRQLFVWSQGKRGDACRRRRAVADASWVARHDPRETKAKLRYARLLNSNAHFELTRQRPVPLPSLGTTPDA